jgi:triacylglycerol lipase
VAPIFLHSYKIIHDTEGPNDGMVSVQSARWGEHVGTWACDHLHIVNRRLMPEIRKGRGDVCGRYVELLQKLADEGLIDRATVKARSASKDR